MIPRRRLPTAQSAWGIGALEPAGFFMVLRGKGLKLAGLPSATYHNNCAIRFFNQPLRLRQYASVHALQKSLSFRRWVFHAPLYTHGRNVQCRKRHVRANIFRAQAQTK